MKRIIVIFLFIIITACQKQSYVKPDLSLNKENSSRLIVYRPQSDWMGIAIDYKVFAGNIELGSLPAGHDVDAFVPSEKTIITVQGHFLGFSDGKPAIQELILEKNNTYYLRFTQKFDGAIVVGKTYTPKGHLSLVEVQKQDFEALK